MVNLLPFVAVVNFEPKQTLTCQNMSETKSIYDGEILMTPSDQCRLSKLNLLIYNRAIFLLNPSKGRTARVKF